MVLFISPFLYLLLTIGFPCSNMFPTQKIRNNTVEVSFGIPGVINKPENNFRVKPIVESEVDFLS